MEDIASVAKLHLQAFPFFFLSFLGIRFLQELYSGILNDTSGMAFVFEDQGQLMGFVAGTGNPQGFYKRLLRQRWWRFAWAAIWPALQKPSIIPRLLYSFSRSKGEDVHNGCATLMSLAVAPEAQGMGFGKQLVEVFLGEAASRGCAEVNLNTDRIGNEVANRFYQRYGFRLAHTYTTHEGREINEYHIRVSAENTPSSG